MFVIVKSTTYRIIIFDMYKHTLNFGAKILIVSSNIKMM